MKFYHYSSLSCFSCFFNFSKLLLSLEIKIIWKVGNINKDIRTIKPLNKHEIVSPKAFIKGADKAKYPHTKNSKYASTDRPITYPKNID